MEEGQGVLSIGLKGRNWGWSSRVTCRQWEGYLAYRGFLATLTNCRTLLPLGRAARGLGAALGQERLQHVSRLPCPMSPGSPARGCYTQELPLLLSEVRPAPAPTQMGWVWGHRQQGQCHWGRDTERHGEEETGQGTQQRDQDKGDLEMESKVRERL